MAPDIAGATLPGRNGPITFALTTLTGDDQFADLCRTPNCFADRLYDLDWRRRKVRPLGVCQVSECHDLSPAWGPRGQTLAFQRGTYLPQTRPPSQPDLEFIAIASGGSVRLVTEPGFFPTWSPDGRRLAFARAVPSSASDPDIVLLNLATGETKRLTWRGGDSPNWASDGRIAFDRHRGRKSDLYVINPSTRRSRAVTRDGRSIAPDWSPYASKIAFAHFHGARPDVDIINPDGTNRRLVVRNGTSPVWSPDGRMLAFVRQSSIWIVRISGVRPRRLFTPRNSYPPSRLAWRPR